MQIAYCLSHYTVVTFLLGIDNHDSGYPGMAVQLYVQAHLGHYHILTQKEYNQKLIQCLYSVIFTTFLYKIS